jgi:uncharacterized protein (DUF983 family)
MFKKGSKLYSIFNNKCPRCHEGDFYVDKNPLHLSKILEIHKNCSKCDLRYTIEPSFFHGAMYVSYGLTVGLSIATVVICLLLGINLIATFISVFVLLFLSSPITLKLSRIIYINMFIGYDKSEETKD